MSEITREMWDELNEKYEKLRLNEEMYRVAIGLTNHTITVVDIPNKTLNQIYNEGDWTGVAASMPNAPESILSTGIIHPDDCEGYREFYRKIYEGVPKGEYTMRVMEENRGWVWFTMYYQTVFDSDGNPLRAICFSDDITVQKKAEEKHQQYKAAVTADADYIWEANLTQDKMLEMDGNLVFEAEDGQELTYTRLNELSMSNVSDEAQKELLRSVFGRESLMEAFGRAKREVSLEYQYEIDDGKGLRWYRATAYLMTNSAEDIVAVICANDVTDKHRELEALELKAQRDSLTGIFNRAFFEQNCAKALEEYPESVHGLLMIDVDDFKRYNDTYGHAFGDTVLKMIAETMQKAFRIGDFLGRVGGDEFMVFMKNVGNGNAVVDRAMDLQKELFNSCRIHNFPSNVSLSIGASLSSTGDNLKSLYLKADKALYESKEKGKNCVSLAQE